LSNPRPSIDARLDRYAHVGRSRTILNMTSQWKTVASVSGSTRPTSVSDDIEMPSVKRPFAACGKLNSWINLEVSC
jgi:hypothetical protein